MASRDAVDLKEWGGAKGTGFSAFEWMWLAVVLVVPALVLALALLLLAGPPFALALVVLYALGLGWWLRHRAKSALTAQPQARPLSPDEEPRLENLVAGFSADLGIDPPAVWTAPGEPNALICSAGDPVLLVRSGLLASFTRTELEAVVAHCLVRIATGDVRRAGLASALGGLAGPAGVSDVSGADSRTVALTRYPPALASAVEKAAAGDDRGPGWFVSRTPGGPSASDRIEALKQL